MTATHRGGTRARDAVTEEPNVMNHTVTRLESAPVASTGARVEIAWATDEEKREILATAEARHRQVMNMRLPTARMLRVKDGDRIVGWVGVDIDHDPVHPEFFSLWVEPEYRALGVSRILRLAVTTFLIRAGVTGFFGRVATSEDREALAYWFASGACRAVSEAAAGRGFTVMCETCNLYGRECTERVYMLASTAKLYGEDRRRVGAVDLTRLPRMLDLAAPAPREPARRHLSVAR